MTTHAVLIILLTISTTTGIIGYLLGLSSKKDVGSPYVNVKRVDWPMYIQLLREKNKDNDQIINLKEEENDL